MPSEEEVRAAVRTARAARKRRENTPPPAKKAKVEIMSISDIDESSSGDEDSDDSMPDISTMLKSSPDGGKSKTLSKKSPAKKASAKSKAAGGKGKAKGKKADSDDDMDSDSGSDSDSDSDAPKKGRGKRRDRVNSAKPANKQRAKSRDNSEEPPAPDANLYKTWKQGGSNVESSAKMMQMVKYLKEWESTGDKTIVFSQCKCVGPSASALSCRVGVEMLTSEL